jgi:hypothetical protein
MPGYLYIFVIKYFNVSVVKISQEAKPNLFHNFPSVIVFSAHF